MGVVVTPPMSCRLAREAAAWSGEQVRRRLGVMGMTDVETEGD